VAAPVIVWFRQDLRLQDNPAVNAALARGGAVLPVYIRDDAGEGTWAIGGAGRWWLHHSLVALDASLRKCGSRLLLFQGDTADILLGLLRDTGATAVHWNRRYEPAIITRDKALKLALAEAGAEVRSHNSALLFEPHTVANKQGRPFQVFTPFWRHCQTLPVQEPSACPRQSWPAPKSWPPAATVAELELLPRRNWADGFAAAWTPGEAGAQDRWRRFLRGSIGDYAAQRNTPGHAGTARLSPHLHFGEIGPRQIWAGVRALGRDMGVFPVHNGAGVFLSEIGWREFAHHLLFHFPQTPARPLRADFARFPWADDPAGKGLKAWQRGLTGYPIVDAGMRELWATGWMHNRVRMIAASFLVKHLRLPWQRGAEWFWDTLADADLANNTLGWQWTAGCGADAAPYFRIFAPVTQGERFDPKGDYVRRWVPELARLPARWIHAPWSAPGEVLRVARVELGKGYPQPIVDHATARAEALAAFKQLRVST
jgi:deoxyribodipyrimidine photo-lyase